MQGEQNNIEGSKQFQAINTNQSINKIPRVIADPQTITKIVQNKKSVVIEYEKVKHFDNESSTLTETRYLTLSYDKAIAGYNVEIDNQDDLYVIVDFKKPWTFFGWSLSKGQ